MKSICIQFRTSQSEYFGTFDELNWRHDREAELDDLLTKHNLGYCDGGQAGNGSMEIFLEVIDVQQAVSLLKQYLTDNEWIPFCKIASLIPSVDHWQVHYPDGAKFSVLEW